MTASAPGNHRKRPAWRLTAPGSAHLRAGAASVTASASPPRLVVDCPDRSDDGGGIAGWNSIELEQVVQLGGVRGRSSARPSFAT
jgi:hypothetical protein